VTVPGVRVTPVRRTVIVAVALVTGQALLCAIIGFVTFGGTDDAAPTAGAAGPRLAGPPIVVSPTGAPSPSRSAASKRRSSTRSTAEIRPTSPAPTSRPARRAPTGPAASPSIVPVVPAPPVPSVSLLPPIDLFPRPSAESSDPTAPAVANARCDDEGATSETAGGEAVRCVRGRTGELRWRLV
jgi:hypothetical protein